MSSPTIDLDMNLGSPSWNDDGGPVVATAIGGSTRNVQLLSSTNAFFSISTAPHDASAEEEPVQSNEKTAEEDIAQSLDDHPKKANLAEMMELLDSWREEVNMMSVKNAIVLDDLVKLGADI